MALWRRTAAADEPPARSVRNILFVIDQLKKPLGGAEGILLKIAARLRPDRFRCSIVCFATNLSAEEIAAFPCPLHVLPMTCSYDLNAARMALRLARLIRFGNVDLVHTFFESSDLWAGIITRLTSHAALVSSRRDMGILRSAKHRWAYRLVAPMADKVLTVSDQVRHYVLAADHLPPGKVVTIYNGIEAAQHASAPIRSEARVRLGLASNERVIAAVGNIRKVKGYDLLLRAARQVCHFHAEAAFIIAGGISEHDHYESLLKLRSQLGLADRFRFIGHQQDVSPLFAAADVFVLPSRSEGFSNALLEAMAAGLPSVATRVGGNAEAIVDGTTGFTVPAEDHNSLANAILSLLDDPQRAGTMGQAARERAATQFSLERMIQQLGGVYDELLQQRRS
jgi:glycosyltransferase involved in cell wall biosynthesis